MTGSEDEVTQEVIDDLVVLGRAGPELISDGRHTVCLGGWSESKGFVRLYPTHKFSEAQRWNKIKVPVEQDRSHDWRDESYKIQGSQRDWDTLYEKIEVVDKLSKDEWVSLIKDIPTTCPNRLNDEKKSMGLVKPAEIHGAELREVDDPDPIQTDIEGNRLRSKGTFPYKLHIEYTCEDCEAVGNHDPHCIEWGVYKWWENHPDEADQVIDNLRLFDEDYKKYFFIGNQKNHPRGFIIISVIRWKEHEDQSGLDKFI